jgi:glyoxylase-like metal-dependent hydrolase (beta-lactamase superfamily II)
LSLLILFIFDLFFNNKTMRIIVLETPDFKIDGGAYFGVVPKTIWEKKYPADENNMCNAACRSLLIDDGENIILIDNGIGDEPENKTAESYYTDYSKNLEINLKKAGYSNEDITHVVLTHLHFDHCGGTTKPDKQNNTRKLSFPNASHYVSRLQWENALNPNYREKSSYLKENFGILENSEKLILVEKTIKVGSNIELRLFNGHTPGLMLPLINTGKQPVFFAGDLIPSKASIPLAWVSAYDLFPLTSIDEKLSVLTEAAENDWILLFQHDYYIECCDVERTEKGVRAKNTYIFNELFA